ncbi:Lysophospholipase [Erysiphe necator]|nr:Lysophospholipase [Erysiphe necator]
MKKFYLFLTTASIVLCEGFTSTSKNVPSDITSNEASLDSKFIAKRAIVFSQFGDYAPAVVPCPPDRPTIRRADNISPSEASWLKLRREKTVQPMIDWLSRISIADFDAASYINSVQQNPENLPNIAIAISGGGYRALMCGAGFLAAADARTKSSTSPGHIGGLLQATTYVSGLSGGGWLVGSVFANNFSTVESLRDGGKDSSLWKFGNSILEGPEIKGQIFDTVTYIKKILKNVSSKQDAGFNVSATDFWGRALSFQLIDAPDGGPAYTFSSIALQDAFKDGSIPLPMIVTIRSVSDSEQNSIMSNVFEMNPFELGTWDTNIAGFVPMEYLGSNFSDGAVPLGGDCVKGFDQVGFLIGATSTLFEAVINQVVKSETISFFRKALYALTKGNNDVAQFQPNPFFGFNPEANPTVKSKDLPLVDGGLDGQNLPLLPLLQQSRKVDVIFAVDSSADSQNFPNGTALVATYERALKGKFNSKFSFPSIPDQNTFVNLGLNKRPTFFGCDASNVTGDAPLIVYIPNSEYSAASNTSTFKRKYSESLRNQIIQNGYEFSTQANGTVDPQWPVCMGCAALSRSMTRTRTPIPTACQNCFSSYCWNGTLNQ